MYLIPNDNETYNDYINRILNSRDNKKDNNAYMESHHITPKSMGGNNEANNLVWLYGQEHYYAHKLLALENPDNKALQAAWWNMCHCCGRDNNRNIVISPEEYNEARSIFSTNMKGENNPYYGHCGEKSAWFGKTHSQKSREKISKARKAAPKKDKKPVTKTFTQETKEKMSKNHYDCTGAKNPRAKKVQCIETGMIFNTAKEAGEYYHLTPSNPGSTIRRACLHGGTSGFDNVPLHWKYL